MLKPTSIVACESLESRTLLAAVTFSGTDGDDVVHLRPRLDTEPTRQGNWLLDAFLNADPAGAPTHVVELGGGEPFTFLAGAGNDEVTLEKVSDAPPLGIQGGEGHDRIEILDPALGGIVNVHGGGGNDVLSVAGTAADEDFALRKGSVLVGLREVVLLSFERLLLDSGAGNDVVDVWPDLTLPGRIEIQAGEGDDQVEFWGSSTSSGGPVALIDLSIELGGGNDVVKYRGASAVGYLNVLGDAGDDQFIYQLSNGSMPEFRFDAGDGNDRLSVDGIRETFARHRFAYAAGAGDDLLEFMAFRARATELEIGTDHVVVNRHTIGFTGVERQSYAGDATTARFASDAPGISMSRLNASRFILSGGRFPTDVATGTYRGTIEFEEGNYVIPHQGSCGCGSGGLSEATLIVRAGASVNTARHQAIGVLHIDARGRLTLGRELTMRFIRLEQGATLDLGGYRLNVPVTVDDGALALREIEGWIAPARNEGERPWTGPGITSGTLIHNTGRTLVAYVDATIRGDGNVTLIVDYARTGDATRDNWVNADDYFKIDSGFLAQLADPLYAEGDFNYDGKIDAGDYFLIDSAFLAQRGAPASSVTTSLSAVSSSPSAANDDGRRVRRAVARGLLSPARRFRRGAIRQ